MPVFHSRDLENWTQIGNVLNRQSQLDLTGCDASHGIWAPTIRYHRGRFYMITTVMRGHTINFIVTAENPAGPWSDPIRLDLPDDCIDPSLFFDTDGKCYLTVSRNRQWLINPDTGELLSDMKNVWPGIGQGFVEAPHLYKIGGYYYIMDAEGGTGRGHLAAVGRGLSPWGPFENCPHPVITARGVDKSCVQCCGHADFVDDGKGNFYAVFLAIREVPGRFPRVHHLGRESFIGKVSWQDGWPIVNEGKPVMEENLDTVVIKDNFKQRSPGWVELRIPHPENIVFHPGNLILKGNHDSINSVNSTAVMLLHRPPDKNFEFESEFNSVRGIGGMTLFMNEKYHYDFFRDGENWKLRRVIGDIIVEETLPFKGMKTGFVFRNTRVEFYGIDESGNRISLASCLNRCLSIETAGGFTGLMTGYFADPGAELSVKEMVLKSVNN